MFVAHGPGGYLLWHVLRRVPRWREVPAWVVVAGAMFPDVDLLYFYTLDARQHLHHSYWTHLPAWWLAIGLAGTLALRVSRRPTAAASFEAFVAGVLAGHLALDTVVGKIRWLWPLSLDWHFLASVPERWDGWIWNFVLHWSFLLELGLVAAAGALWWRTSAARSPSALRW